ncbi:sugar ABC transporter permease [candidate division KSB3 bacterium]|uniref:Sugar ABC transporter permease n=1 Tax=candidate division KSB3 bacterium TaxID=2044937 RepID=A0A2G6E7F7_9BACT|nr:MAG: sugar ABC transporter permease [candidate division KSB3 bacterium]PIE30294.1 MAG: sugar ABC transporter permease [candidate division KSB3 bacterium]
MYCPTNEEEKRLPFQRRRATDTRFIALMLVPTLGSILILTYLPAFRGIWMAFQQYNIFDLSETGFNNFQNFRTMVADDIFWLALKNTVIWVVVSLFFQFVLGFALALLLRKPFKGRGLYTGFVFYPWAVSGFIIGLIWRWIFNGSSGVLNDLLRRAGLIEHNIGFLSDPAYALMSTIIANIWYGIPFFAIMILAALQSVPQALYEVADIDGAGASAKFWKVTVPYIKPTLISTTLIRFIWIMNFPEVIFAMTNGGPAGYSHILSTLMIEKFYHVYDYGLGSAIGVVIIVILIVYTISYLKLTGAQNVGDC